jgi:hypothetical protein
MDEDVRFYKGKYLVKILAESPGNWVVKALEPFEDIVNGERLCVKVGEKRIVAPNLLFKRRGLSPPIKEHTYELKMEKKLKWLVDEKKNAGKEKTR